jgi:predicted acyl esterase
VTIPARLEAILRGDAEVQPRHDAGAIARETVWATMRDGIRLATDVYRPPVERAPAIVMRTPYGRALIEANLLLLARCGYVVVSQDCRGTGDSEPDHWDFSIYEAEDCVDFVEWVTQQPWYDGFIGSCGGSYVGWLQGCMAMHPAMSAIAPEVAGFGGPIPAVGATTHMFVNAYSRTVGKGEEKVALGYDEMERLMLEETLATGYFDAPLHVAFPEALLERYPELRALSPGEARRRLYELYSGLPPAQRVELVQLAAGARGDFTYQGVSQLSSFFGRDVPGYDYLYPSVRDPELFTRLHAPVFEITGWYDWGLDYTLATWDRLMREARDDVRTRSRLFIGPNAHNAPGYHEGREAHPELDRVYRVTELPELLLRWCDAVRDDALDDWPVAIYYLMGANEWRSAPAWPPPEAETRLLHLHAGGGLDPAPPAADEPPDRYVYDPDDPTPTKGGSIISYVYPPGSVDVADVQARADVLTYTTPPLEEDLDVVGPLRVVLHASSSALETDFFARLSDVFPDGRAIQLQNGALRTRYRNPAGEAEVLEPGRVYELEIALAATANRFRAGHRLRLDICSADFPKLDRNANRGGEPGPPVRAEQTIHHDADHPSRLVLSVLA